MKELLQNSLYLKMLKHLYLTLIICVAFTTTITAQHEVPTPQNTYNRDAISLNGQWQYFVDRYEAFFYDFVRTPFDESDLWKTDFAALDATAKDKTDRLEYSFTNADSLTVPGDWNNQREKLFYYEGSVWYRKNFTKPELKKGEKLLLHFGAVNYRADVYVNGKKAGMHEGGFTAFTFDISTLIKDGNNSLVVRVDNKRYKEAVPTDVTDWWNYGGITRDVSLIAVPDSYIENYHIQLDKEDATLLSGFVTLSEIVSAPITIQSKALGIKKELTPNGSYKIPFSFKINESVTYWTPENPKLYNFEITTGTDALKDQIGLRTITTKGAEILLNGKPLFLRGICAHEENSEKGGRAATKEDALRLLTAAKELKANYMRLAHYPHNEYMPRLADSLGILLWEEIPVYWTIDWKNLKTYKNAETQLSELIQRDRNRASVIIWSLANETPIIEERLNFLKNLAQKARELDHTRLISAALFKENLGDGKYTITDPFSEYTDLVSFNEYLGWYEGMPEIIDGANFTFSTEKPVMVSEFGAGAKAGFHADATTRWSEEFQDDLYKRTLKLLDRMPNLAGLSPWILFDFRSPRRMLPAIQDGWNRKGLIGEKGDRKLAFYTLQKYYEDKIDQSLKD